MAERLLPFTHSTALTRMKVERTLPAAGEILVQVGETVLASQVIARTTGQNDIYVVNVKDILNMDDLGLSHVMTKERGDRVQTGETIAARPGILPFLHKPCRSPVSGEIKDIAYGWALIETGAEQVDVLAFIPGRVTSVVAHRSATIETIGAVIEAACGIGKEVTGVLKMPVNDRTSQVSPDDVGEAFNKTIVVAGAEVSSEVLEQAREVGVAGLIAGGMDSSLLGQRAPLPVVATEGYGHRPMSQDVFDILKGLEGQEVSLSAQMGEPWDNSRPMLIAPLAGASQDETQALANDTGARPVRVGDKVRAVRSPLSGCVGQIKSMLEEPRRPTSGLTLAGALVSFPEEEATFDAKDEWAPWLNLERMG
jgi:hypothetical protein